MSKKPKSKKIYPDDDGRVIYNMNLPNFKWYDKSLPDPFKETNASREVIDPIRVDDKSERRALVISAYKAYLPKIICIILGFTAIAVLLWLWLK